MTAGSFKDRAGKGAAWSTIDSISQQVLSFAFFVVLGRLLDHETFGIVSTALVFVFLMRSAVLNAILSSLVTLPKPEDEDYDAAFWLLVGVSLCTVLLLILTATPLARLYRIPEMAPVLQATSLMVFAIGLGYAHQGWARRNFRFKDLALRNMFGTVAGGIGGVGVAILGHGLAALVTNQLLAAVVSLILLWMLLPWRPHLRFSGVRARALLTTALPRGATQSLQFAVQNFDTVVVTYMLGPASGGLYAAARRVTLAVQLTVWQPLSAVALPVMAEVADNPVRLGRVLVRMATVVMAVTAPVFFGVGTCAVPLIHALFGSRWLGAAPVLTVLGTLGLSIPSMGILHVLLMVRGQNRIVLYFALLQMLLALTAITLFGHGDVKTIAYCLTLPSVITYLGSYVYVRRIVGEAMKEYPLSVARPLLAAMLMALAITLTPDLGIHPLLQLLLLVSIGGVIYLAALFFLARETFTDLLDFAAPLLRKFIR